MNYNYKGKKYSLQLENDGEIHCNELGIQARTAEDVQALIRKHVEELSKLPRVNVLMIGEWGDNPPEMKEGTSSLKNVGGTTFHKVWVQPKEKGASKGKEATSQVYVDSPENRKKIAEYIKVKTQILALEKQADKIEESFERVKAI